MIFPYFHKPTIASSSIVTMTVMVVGHQDHLLCGHRKKSSVQTCQDSLLLLLLLQGSTIIRKQVPRVVKVRDDGTPVERVRLEETVMYCDIIGPEFWHEYGTLLDIVC